MRSRLKKGIRSPPSRPSSGRELEPARKEKHYFVALGAFAASLQKFCSIRSSAVLSKVGVHGVGFVKILVGVSSQFIPCDSRARYFSVEQSISS